MLPAQRVVRAAWRVLMYEKPIEAIATLVEHRDVKLAYVTLPNGKRILVHREKGSELNLLDLPLQSKLRLEMTTFDFEKGRVVEVIS